jgi:hypothetical protein
VQRLALVEGQRAGQLVAPAGADVGGAMEGRRAREGGLARPARERGDRGVDRGARVVAIAPRDLTEVLAGGGAARPLRGAAARVAPLGPDEHPRRSES